MYVVQDGMKFYDCGIAKLLPIEGVFHVKCVGILGLYCGDAN